MGKSTRWFIIAALFFVPIMVIVLGYWLKWSWLTEFIGGYSRVTIQKSGNQITVTTELPQGKTIWDVLNLLGVLAIPVAIAAGTLLFTAEQSKVQNAENEDNQRERALQEYIDKMSELLLKESLRESVPLLSINGDLVIKGIKIKPDEEVRTVARAQTLTVLSRLDGKRKGSVLKFLYESRLIEKDSPIVELQGADLSGAILHDAKFWKANTGNAHIHRLANFRRVNLSGANLSGADIRFTDICNANLSDAVLTFADLSISCLHGTNLARANLKGAILISAILSDVNFTRATITEEQLIQSYSLKGTIMPDGSRHS